jgi:hypothetical protein
LDSLIVYSIDAPSNLRAFEFAGALARCAILPVEAAGCTSILGPGSTQATGGLLLLFFVHFGCCSLTDNSSRFRLWSLNHIDTIYISIGTNIRARGNGDCSSAAWLEGCQRDWSRAASYSGLPRGRKSSNGDCACSSPGRPYPSLVLSHLAPLPGAPCSGLSRGRHDCSQLAERPLRACAARADRRYSPSGRECSVTDHSRSGGSAGGQTDE